MKLIFTLHVLVRSIFTAWGYFVQTFQCSTALLLYDCVITIGQEINFMWSNERKGSALIFAANRCIVLGMAVSIILELPNIPGINVVIVILFQVAYIASLAIWTVFSALRVYAICDRRRYLPVITTVMGLIPVGTELVRMLDTSLFASTYSDPGYSGFFVL
ncbi:hypothetical protein WOLCODRAFT_84712 [Wolfiporia cocos MD-104 SS10]|uniref:DUF6533 domain-containing protein n=1 Tax=Wolfiporia cocos (strain MD-104) TaxID=742152 RepID=A0A2H3JMM7_WOLCO|nr:hypothetical protein WOLCODRAFT_84712 [Wolfiporia cocos MD-104 SS10]